MKTLQELALDALLNLLPAEDVDLHHLVKSTFSGARLALPLNRLLDGIKRIHQLTPDNQRFIQSKLYAYGLLTTVIEEAEHVISQSPVVEQLAQREMLLEACVKEASLPMPEMDAMLSTQGVYVALRQVPLT